MRVTILLALAILGVAGCRTLTGPAGQHFDIVLDQREYTQREGSQLEIGATVTNATASRDFYSNVGDAYNAAIEQPTIYAAKGTHAVIERRVSASEWENANTDVLSEGSRFVILRAGKSYRLTGSIAPNAPGLYRIRLDHSAINNDPAVPLPFRDYSVTFRVR